MMEICRRKKTTVRAVLIQLLSVLKGDWMKTSTGRRRLLGLRGDASLYTSSQLERKENAHKRPHLIMQAVQSCMLFQSCTPVHPAKVGGEQDGMIGP